MHRFAYTVGPVSLILSCALIQSALAQGSPVGAAWVVHKDPLGFNVSVPPGWGVSTKDGGRIVVHNPDESVFAVVQPFLTSQATRSEDWIGKSLDRMKTLFPEAAVQREKQLSTRPDDVVATATYLQDGKPCQVNLICSILGSSGMVYAIAAPHDRFSAEKQTLIKALRSFHFVQPTTKIDSSAGQSNTDVAFEKWTEPKQGVLSYEVPRGWTTDGVMNQPSTADVRSQVSATSPDGLTHLQVGDVSIPSFSLPTPTSEYFARQGGAGAAFREGATFTLPTGLTMIRLHYNTGTEFSKWIVQNKCEKLHPGLRITESREVAHDGSPQTSSRSTTGVTNFTYQEDGRAMCGLVLVTTEVTMFPRAGAGGIWRCKEMFYGTGPDTSDRQVSMLTTMEHMSESRKFDPTWLNAQLSKGQSETDAYAAATQRSMDASNAEYRRVQADRRERINANFQANMAAKTESTRHWTNFALGQTDVRDPQTGQTYKVAAGHNYYWAGPPDQNNQAVIVGQDGYQRPDTDFNPLVEY